MTSDSGPSGRSSSPDAPTGTSAVVGVPAQSEQFAYISCGTWGLVGVELDAPLLGDDARAANFTNERGVDGRTRFLRNVMGLWLLQDSLRTWAEAGSPEDLDRLLEEAAALPLGGPVWRAGPRAAMRPDLVFSREGGYGR